IDASTERHTADYIENQVKDVITELGISKFTAVIGDNASNMKRMKTNMNKNYPHILPIGCAAHIINLFIQDLCKLQDISIILKKAKKIALEIKGSAVKLGTFRKFSKGKCNSLQVPIITRWYSVGAMVNSIIKAKEVLQQLAISSEIKLINRDIILNVEFWNQIEELQLIFNPLSEAIGLLEADNSTLSIVPQIFKNIKTSILDIDEGTIGNNTQIMELLESRKNMAIKEWHLLANLIDPNFKGAALTEQERFKGEKYMEEYMKVCGYWESLEIRSKIFASYNEFIACKGNYNRRKYKPL
ncbi:uncharacterized protein B4U80_11972, partial [Leptotrombidium deliense]